MPTIDEQSESILRFLFFGLVLVIVLSILLPFHVKGQDIILGSRPNNLTMPEIYSKTIGSVVGIEGQTVRNTGIIYDKEGHILTSIDAVNVEGEIFVTLSDGTKYNSRLLAADTFSNLALLYIPNVPKDKLVPFPFGNSSELKEGEQVAAIGNPFGISNVMTEGIVGKLGALYPLNDATNTASFSIPDIIVTNVPINPGNSGGPLVNMHGELVGMNIAIFSSTGEFAGISFAIPSNLIKRIGLSLVDSGYYEHPWVGISGIDVTPSIADMMDLTEAKGFLITDIAPGSPADVGGMIAGQQNATVDGVELELGGDIVIGIDNKIVKNIDDILSHLEGQKEVGDNVKITILREKQSHDLNLKLAPRPIQSNSTDLG